MILLQCCFIDLVSPFIFTTGGGVGNADEW
nr:MAG TPA: hypothetical protein [Bacteriophage sp.]